MIVTVFSRPGCHLCEEALGELEAMKAGHPGLEIEEIDIDTDDLLFKRYLERIPVVEIGGETVSELVLDRGAVEASLGQIR